MRSFFFLLALAITLGSCGGAKKQSGQVSLTGTLVQKRAAKTVQSYCAGGSEFYTLQTDKEEYILTWDQMPSESQLKAYISKSVQVVGTVETYKIEPPEDPNTPNPGTVKCIRLNVLSLKGS